MTRVLTTSVSILATSVPAMSEGISQDARYLSDQISEPQDRVRKSIGVGFFRTYAELEQVRVACASPDWNGYGAEPVTSTNIEAATRFLEAIPLGLKPSSVGADPDGHVTFEWYKSRRRSVSISVAPDGMLHYAAVLGASTKYGSSPLLGVLPNDILNLIREVES